MSLVSGILGCSILRRAILWAFLLAALNGFASANAPEQSSSYAQYFNLLENFVGWAQQHWNDADKCFNADGAGVSWARGNGNVCLAAAVVLTERPQQTKFGNRQVPREQILANIKQAIRTVCLANRNCKHPQAWKEPKWGGPDWQSGLETSGWLWAAWLLRNKLDAETWLLAQDVAAAEADHLKKTIPSQVKGNTGAEDCIWNASMLGAAANLLSHDSRAATWDEWCKRWALNAISRETDRSSSQQVDGRPLSEWLVSTNVHPDLTLENHGFWSIPYQAEYGELGEAILAYHLQGKPVPQALTIHADELWTNVLAWLVLPDGDLLCPQGQDWAPRDIQQIWTYALLSSYHKFASAAETEANALRLLTARQSAFGDGSLHANNFGYETHLARHWAVSALMHKHFDSIVAPETDSAGEKASGVTQTKSEAAGSAPASPLGARTFSYVDVGVFRTTRMVSSVTWDESRQAVMVVPSDPAALGQFPSFTAYSPQSGLGWIRLPHEKTPLKFTSVSNVQRLENAEFFAVAFRREVPDLVCHDIGYVALSSGPVVVFSRWTARANLEGAEVVSHPFYWLAIDDFLPARQIKGIADQVWSIDGKLQMQVIGGVNGKVRPDSLLGSVQESIEATKPDAVFDSSVCIYQPLSAGINPQPVVGDPEKISISNVTISWPANGKLSVTSR